MAGMPRPVSERIMKRCSAGKPLVIIPKKGVPARVYDLQAYLQTQARAKTVKPWTHRKKRQGVPDPLGAIDGRVLAPIRRENIYE